MLTYKRKPLAVNTFKAAGQTDLVLYRLHSRNLHTASTCRCWTHFYYSNFLFMKTLDYQELNHVPLFFHITLQLWWMPISFASLASCPSFIYCLSGCSLGNVNLSVKLLLFMYLWFFFYFWQPPPPCLYMQMYIWQLQPYSNELRTALFFTANAHLNSWITFTGHTRRLQKWLLENTIIKLIRLLPKKSKKIFI